MHKFVVMLMVSVIVAMFAVSCDDDCPTCPPPPQEEIVSDYNVYLGGYPHSIYVYNTKEMALIDSLDPVAPGTLQNLVVSGDGRYLLLSYNEPAPGGVLVYDLETRDTVKTLPPGEVLEVSNTGKYIMHSIPGRTDFLDGQTLDTVFTFPFSVGASRFSLDDSKLYCIFDHHYIHIYDLATRTLDTSFMYADNEGRTPWIYRMQPDATGRKLYFAVTYEPYVYYLLAYSMDLDSTTMYYRLIGPPYGDMRITPDGRQILYSDPGDLFFEMPSSNYVFFFDPETDAIISIVDAGHSVMNETSNGFMPGMLAITPDGRYTIAACAERCPAFGMIDNVQHRFVHVSLFEAQSFWVVTCQKTPN
jgi:hypothetical protein